MPSKNFFSFLPSGSSGRLLLAFLLMISLVPASISALDLKVLLIRSSPAAEISCSTAITLESPSDHSSITILSTKPVRITAEQGRISVGQFGVFSSPIRLRSEQPVRLNGRAYRGSLTVHNRSGILLVVNEVDLEQYLYGVVPREISKTWSAEVIKAQAVVARTFALRLRLDGENPLYDLDNSTFSQMYEGADIEDARVNGYIDQTSGEVLAYKNVLAQVYYHSTCGGETESAEDLWGKFVPYLQSVTCRFCAPSPYFSWTFRLSTRDVEKLLKKKGFDLLPETVRVKRLTASRRAGVLVFSGKKASLEMKANDFRTLAGTKELKSLLFTVRSGPSGFIFEGHGFGHGVGMCQWGAKGMSDQGMEYLRILQYYFRGTKVVRAPQMAGNR